MSHPIGARIACLLIASAAAVALACAKAPERGGGVVYGAEFPSQQELARIERAPVPQAIFAGNLREVPQWALQEPLPERIWARRWIGRSLWDGLLSEHADASGGRIVPTEAMQCVARELARFELEHRGQPDPSVKRFIVGGCNASVGDVAFGALQGEVSPSVDEGQLFERWREPALAVLQRFAESEERSVAGIAFARRGLRAVVFVAVGHPEVELEPVSTSIAGERFELRGRAIGSASSIDAAVNRGYFEVADCEPVGDVRPPAFHLACQLDPYDDWAWVTLSVTRPNRVLGNLVLHAMVRPLGRVDRVYRRFHYTSSRPLAELAEFTPAFVEELNGVRRRAGLGPLTLEVKQSETAARMVPHYFAAVTGAVEEKEADLVALGLLAGWNVEGTIRRGGFASGATAQTHDLSVLLASALEEPMSRGTLLDPEAERLAVGPLMIESGGVPVMAAVVSSYALFHQTTHDGDADHLLARLEEERRERGLPAPYRLVNLWMDAMGAAGEIGRGQTPDYALDDLLETSSNSLRREVTGWYGETSDLEEFKFPEEYVTARRLGTAIGVSHRKGPEEAWGRYVVVIVSTSH